MAPLKRTHAVYAAQTITQSNERKLDKSICALQAAAQPGARALCRTERLQYFMIYPCFYRAVNSLWQSTQPYTYHPSPTGKS